MTVCFLKRCLLLFWAMWHSLVLATNLGDALKELGVLGEHWRFASGNFGFITATTARYAVPNWANALLFSGVLAWESSAAILFWLAWWGARRQDVKSCRFLYPAFSVSLMLWGAFMLADELFVAYAVEATHLRLFIAQLATLLAVVLLPEDDRPTPSGLDRSPEEGGP